MTNEPQCGCRMRLEYSNGFMLPEREVCPLCKAAPETAKRLRLAERTIEAYEQLCTAYRLGKCGLPEKALDVIAKWKAQKADAAKKVADYGRAKIMGEGE